MHSLISGITNAGGRSMEGNEGHQKKPQGPHYALCTNQARLGIGTGRDAEVQFSPVQPKFLRTANWTFGSVQKIPELQTGPSVQVKEVRSAVQSDLNREPDQ